MKEKEKETKSKADAQAFAGFYRASRKRLARKAAAYNNRLRKEKHPLLRTFMEDIADLNEGGKMLRGMLINLGYHLTGCGDVRDSDDLALAFEIFQTGVLIHDDAIDHAGTRRGKITVHRRYEHRLNVRNTEMLAKAESPADIAQSVAVCAGDLGLYLSNRHIVESYKTHPACAAILSLFDDIVLKTISGELLDVVLPYELQDTVRTPEEQDELLERSVRDIYYLKTACYSVIGPLQLGMTLGGADRRQLRAMHDFAEDLGIAYQIMDDILGIYADPETLGKDVGSDICEYKQTILYMYVRTKRPDLFPALEEVYGEKKITKKELRAVQDLFRDSGALGYARDALRECFERAEKKLEKMRFVPEEDKAVLRGFMDYCRGRRY